MTPSHPANPIPNILTGLHFGIADGVLRALTGPGRFEAL